MQNTIDIEKLHEKANIIKNLCLKLEEALNKNDGEEIFKGWKKLDGFRETRTNFKGILYSNGAEYVICYAGTDSKSIKDHIENIVMGIFGKTLQMRIANYYYKKCKEKFGFYNDNLTLAGHSEGGTEASYAGIKNRVKVVTFNPYGLSRKLYDTRADYSNLITNYRDASDLVSKLKENPGRTYIVPTTVKQCFIKRLFGSIKSHRLENLGDCQDSVPLEEYRENHPCFINSYKLLKKL